MPAHGVPNTRSSAATAHAGLPTQACSTIARVRLDSLAQEPAAKAVSHEPPGVPKEANSTAVIFLPALQASSTAAIVDGQSCGTRADTLSSPAGSCVRLLHMGSGGVKVQPIIGEQPDQPKTVCDESNFVPSNRPQNSTPYQHKVGEFEPAEHGTASRVRTWMPPMPDE